MSKLRRIEEEFGLNIVTFGTFDCFHIGHLNIFMRIKEKYPSSRLIVGVSTDALNQSKKGRTPIVSFTQRRAIVGAIRHVDETFPEESLEKKRMYLSKYGADILVMGDDHSGIYDHLSDLCEIWYLPRTPQISTTEIIDKIIHGPE